MPRLKIIYHNAASMCRWAVFVLNNWVLILIALCVISPISPHARIPYAISYSECSYIGTRGIIEHDALTCPLITIIDTRSHRGQS
ncbi:MAG: hypothetical protein COA69_08575 [Robiginitomaculum sp.]|nr:MAG: hypothetical protein COA69_08575 [Robiginitomaculum sp.]